MSTYINLSLDISTYTTLTPKHLYIININIIISYTNINNATKTR